jgi:TctA family transporter
LLSRVLIGTLVGVLPGLGPVATIAMLLPATLTLPADSALIMLAGIYYGAQYGGSTTAILINLPGESSSVVTTLDGHAMARQGRAGAALATACHRLLLRRHGGDFRLAFLAPPLANLAINFQAPEYFSLMVLGLIASSRAGAGFAPQRAGYGGARSALGSLRHRRHVRPPSVSPSVCLR